MPTLNRNEFVEALLTVMPGVAKKDILPLFTQVVLSDDCLISYNDEIMIRSPFKTGVNCSVPASRLAAILNKFSSEEVAVDLTSDGTLTLQSVGKSIARASIKTTALEQSILDMIKSSEIASITEWEKLPGNFLEGLDLCLISTSKEMFGEWMSGVSVVGDNLASSDDFRVSLFALDSPMDLNATISAEAATAMKLLAPTHFAVRGSWLHTCNKDNAFLGSRLISAVAPLDEVNKIISAPGTAIKLPEKLLDQIEVAEVLSEGDSVYDQSIKLSIANGKFICRGEIAEVGWAEGEAFGEYGGPPVVIKISPKFLKEIIKHSYNMILTERSAIFVLENGFKHSISLFLE